jgi:hypothetical protein
MLKLLVCVLLFCIASGLKCMDNETAGLDLTTTTTSSGSVGGKTVSK